MVTNFDTNLKKGRTLPDDLFRLAIARVLKESDLPGRPARPCTHPGCGVLTRGKVPRCPEHPEESWARNEYANNVKRITGPRLQKLRRQLFQREPLCVACKNAGRVSLATQRDHIIPLAEGGADNEQNTQGLCAPCHELKRQEEVKRGVARSKSYAIV